MNFNSFFFFLTSGEDRWLSTLLLQQGYRVEYCAASDAMTQTPEGFKEFFNQRRRWIPSTLANIMDLLQSYRTTVKMNDNISYLYIAYQAALMLSTTLGPATVLLMMAGAFNAVMHTSLWQSYLLAVGPTVVYLVMCFILKSDYQLTIGAILSAVYSLLMMSVIVGTMVQVVEDTFVSPNAIFLLILLAVFIISAMFHPQEFLCLLSGALYFLCIPSGYVLLIVYAMCNMHVVSWGTREKAAQVNRPDPEKEKVSPKSSLMSWLGRKEEEETCCPSIVRFFRRLCGGRHNTDVNTEILRCVMEKLDKVEAGVKSVNTSTNGSRRRGSSSRSRRSRRSNIGNIEEEDMGNDESGDDTTSTDEDLELEEIRDPLVNPKWLEDISLGNGEIKYLPEHEIGFWQQCIAKYLHPISVDKNHQAQVANDLKSMRNNVAFAFFMLNAFWMIIIFMLQSVKDKVSIPIPRPGQDPLPIEPLGLVFLVFFAFILILQFGAMLRHRYGTLLHILASTELRCCRKRYDPKKHIEEAVEYARVLQRLYGIDDDTDQDLDYSSSQDSKSNLHRSSALSDIDPLNCSGIFGSSGRGTTTTVLTNLDPLFPAVYDNMGYTASNGNLAFDEGASSRRTVKDRGFGPSKRSRNRQKGRHTDKNSTLRRAFVRRYTRLMRQQSTPSQSISMKVDQVNQRARPSIRTQDETYTPQFNQLNR